MSEEKITGLSKEQLDGVAGGFDNYGRTCPNCGSDHINFLYEHDEVGVFFCENCKQNVSIGY